MILHGSIERFQVGSVLQFLAQNCATGILEIHDFEEYGYIYLVRGRLEAISLPLSDDRLGIHLVKAGLLSEGQLTRVLMEEAGREDLDGHKPLGQRLVERGFASETTIRQAMCRLTMARMFELAHWRNGTFTYDEPDEMPVFQISIRGDVQELLLRTQLRIDRGELPRKKVGAGEPDDVCHGCPVTDCSPAIKLKYLKKELCLWRKMSVAPGARGELRSEPTQFPASAGHGGEPAAQGTWVEF